MSNFVTETPRTIHIKILEKPHADGRFYIRDKYIDKAQRFNKRLVIEYQGEKFACTAKEWLKDSKVMSKVYLIPERPMKLFGNYINRFKIEKQSDNKDTQVNFFNLGVLGDDFIKQARLKIQKTY